MCRLFFSFRLQVLPSLLTLLTLSGQFLPATADAANQGNGRVSMQGSIIDTPCAIDVNSRDQTIDMSTLPLGQIIRDGHGPQRPFSILLVNCSLKPARPGAVDWSHFLVTFDGATTRNNLFDVKGAARGIGLKIADREGVVAVPGEPMPAGSLHTGSMKLDYTLSLMSNHEALRAGTYWTTIRFKLDYF